jgi:hypothetical protein
VCCNFPLFYISVPTPRLRADVCTTKKKKAGALTIKVDWTYPTQTGLGTGRARTMLNYELFVNSSCDGDDRRINLPDAQTSITFSDIVEGCYYVFQVRGQNEAGYGLYRTSSQVRGLTLATKVQNSATWGNSSFAHCKLNYSLQQLRQREIAGLPPRHRTGGLGLKMQPSVFEAWVCVDQHECISSSAPVDGWFCWVIDERIALPRERAPEQFVPWGHNGYLKLFRSST